MTERILRMAKSVMKSSIYPNPKSVQYQRTDILLPDVIKNTKRLCEYLVAQDVVITDDSRLVGQIRFDGSVPADVFHRAGHRAFAEIKSEFYLKPLDNLVTFEWQHSTADFADVIENGIEGISARVDASLEAHKDDPEKREFLIACKMMCDGIIKWEEKCAEECRMKAFSEQNELRRAELLKMAENLDRVPRKPARSFYEAVQAVYFCFDFLPDSLGTPDRYLYKTFKTDIDNGKITIEDAKSLIQEMFIRLQSHTAIGSSTFTRGGESHFSVGGYTAEGEDGYNELSELILDSLAELPLYIPQVSLRWTKKTPRSVLRHVMDLERNDKNKRIAFVSDEPRIAALTSICGLSYEDAVKYTMVGCNEPALQGGIWLGGATVNLARSVTNMLSKRREELLLCKSYDELYAIYKEELIKDIDEIIRISNAFNLTRAKDTNVLSSLFLKGCIENGVSVTKGGSLAISGFDCIGVVNIIDSLTVIKQFVFEEKTLSLETLLSALDADWEGYDGLKQKIAKQTYFFGNGAPISDEISRKLSEDIFKHLNGKKNIFGKPFLVGNLIGYHPHHAFFGSQTAATPDGRKNGELLTFGIGQNNGKDREGLTALLSSIATFDPTGIFCGPTITNINLDSKLLREDNNFEKLVDIMETYFKLGGLHFQLNNVTKEDLIAAKATPEKYSSLRVRVSGFADYFVKLGANIQDDVISRTEIKG